MPSPWFLGSNSYKFYFLRSSFEIVLKESLEDQGWYVRVVICEKCSPTVNWIFLFTDCVCKFTMVHSRLPVSPALVPWGPLQYWMTLHYSSIFWATHMLNPRSELQSYRLCQQWSWRDLSPAVKTVRAQQTILTPSVFWFVTAKVRSGWLCLPSL